MSKLRPRDVDFGFHVDLLRGRYLGCKQPGNFFFKPRVSRTNFLARG